MEKFKDWVQKYCKRKYCVCGFFTRDDVIKAMVISGKRSRQQTIEETVDWMLNHISDYFGCSPVYPQAMIKEYKQAVKGE